MPHLVPLLMAGTAMGLALSAVSQEQDDFFAPSNEVPKTATRPWARRTGEAATPRHSIAYTVRGTGGVRLLLSPFDVEYPTFRDAVVRSVDDQGSVTERRVLVPPFGAELAVPNVDEGVLTVEVSTDEEPGLLVRALPLGETVSVGTEDFAEIVPDLRRLALWRLPHEQEPLVATLLGDGQAHIVLRAASGDAQAARLEWMVKDPGGTPVTRGEVGLTAPLAPFEKTGVLGLEDAESPSEPLVYLARGKPLSRLELRALSGRIDVALETCDERTPTAPAPPYDLPLKGVRLRYASYTSRACEPFLPDNHMGLREAGRAVDLVAQVRLEPIQPTPRPPAALRTVQPAPPFLRHLLVEPTQTKGQWRSFHRTEFHVGEEVSLYVPARGARTGRLELDYFVGAEALGGWLEVREDGVLLYKRRILVPRGRLRLKHRVPGDHHVRIEGPKGILVSKNPRTERNSPRSALRAVFRLQKDMSMSVPITLAEGESKWLVIVMYVDAAPLTKVRLRAVVGADDVGVVPASRRAFQQWTVDRVFMPTRARWLDQAGEAKGRATFAIPLHAELGPGTHPVTLTLLNGPRRVYARFLESGTASDAVSSTFQAEVDED